MGLHERPDGRVDRVLGVQAADVGREHVGEGLRAPLRAVEEPAGDGHARLLGVLVGQEEQRAFRHDAHGALGEGVLDGGGDLRRAGLVVEHHPVDLVAVHPTLGILQRDAGIEAGRECAELR